MTNKRIVRMVNKSDRPDNIVKKETELIEKCRLIESKLPLFMKDYFIFIRSSVVVSSRLEYLKDVHFFCDYLVNKQELTKAKTISEITIEDFQKIKARDINVFIGDYCTRYYKDVDGATLVLGSSNRALARRKSSISGLFKFLYRNEQLKENITMAMNPIKLPRPHPDSIKKLEINEVAVMLDAIDNGTGLVGREKVFWRKTKLRDKAIIILFVTYGLRINELRELNISSFNFSRGEYKIYRKRSKEVEMPINMSCAKVILDYINNERTPSEELQDEYKDALFLSIQNKRMSERALRDLTKKLTSIGMQTSRDKGYSPHKLRATAASSLIQEGFSIYDVQNLLDHDNVTTTQLYAAHKKTVKRDIIDNFEWLEDDSKESLDLCDIADV